MEAGFSSPSVRMIFLPCWSLFTGGGIVSLTPDGMLIDDIGSITSASKPFIAVETIWKQLEEARRECSESKRSEKGRPGREALEHSDL